MDRKDLKELIRNFVACGTPAPQT